MPSSRSITSTKPVAGASPRPNSATNRSPASMASSKREWRARPSARRIRGVSRPTFGANARNAAIQRPAIAFVLTELFRSDACLPP